jgi:hypothetical protein
MAVEVFGHPLQQGAQVTAGQGEVQHAGIEIFLGDDHDVHGGNDQGRIQPKTLPQHAFDAIADNGIADLFSDGHAQAPRRVPIRARENEDKEIFPMIAAARFEAGRELPVLPEPVRR